MNLLGLVLVWTTNIPISRSLHLGLPLIRKLEWRVQKYKTRSLLDRQNSSGILPGIFVRTQFSIHSSVPIANSRERPSRTHIQLVIDYAPAPDDPSKSL